MFASGGGSRIRAAAYIHIEGELQAYDHALTRLRGAVFLAAHGG